MFARELGLNSKLAAAFFLLMAFCMLLTRLFAGTIFDRKDPALITVLGILLLAAGSLALALATNAVWFLAGGVGVGLGTGILFPVFQAMMNNLVHKDQQGVANATYYIGLDLGWVGGSAVAGMVVGVTSIAASFMYNFGLCLVGLLLFLAVNLKQYNRDKVV